MILSRLSRAIREQNWFAVILEFIIVVVGIVVGFQLTERYNEAQRSSAEAEYLNGVAGDYLIYQNILICRMNVEDEIMRGLMHVLDAINGVELDERQQARANLALTMSHVSQPGLPLEGNTSALVAGDLVGTISDDELRGLILAAQSISTSAVTSMSQVHNFMLNTPLIERRTIRELDPQSGYFVTTGFDPEVLRSQPEIRNILMDLYNLHLSAHASDARQKNAVDNVLGRLEVLGVREAPEEEPTCWQGPLPTADLG